MSNRMAGKPYHLRKTRVDVNSNQWVKNPKQEYFMRLYFDPRSETFANAYRSALKAGYSPSYAVQLTAPAIKNLWLQNTDKISLTSDHIVAGIEEVAMSGRRERDRLKAYELLAKMQGLLIEKHMVAHVNIEQALDNLK